MLTDCFQDDNRSTQRLKDAGYDEALIAEAKGIGLPFDRPAKWAQIFKY
jgi:hypothetical protein